MQQTGRNVFKRINKIMLLFSEENVKARIHNEIFFSEYFMKWKRKDSLVGSLYRVLAAA